MRIFRVVNAVPNDHSNETNDDAEPSIAVNPANPHEMVITAFTPPDSGVSNGPLYFSTDGGENWSLKFDVPGGMPNDQSISFGTASNELYMAALKNGGQQLDVMRSADPSTGATFPLIEPERSLIDQPWVQAATVIGGPDNGKDRIYVGYNDDNLSQSATVDVCLDALATNPAFTQVRLETRAVGTGLRDGYAIRPVTHRDGTVYVAYEGWRSGTFLSNVTMDMVVARDDNWGANNFTDLNDPSDGKAGRIVATGVVVNDGGFLGGERLNNDFNIAVDLNDSDIIYIVWCDNSGPNYTLRVRRSLNRGVDWSGDLITVDNATLACLAINTKGTVALLCQQLVAGKWETHFRSTNDGTVWDDTLLARTATAGFIGDWTRMTAVGPHFYGVFPATNTPDAANFFPNGGGTFRFQRNTQGTQLVGADGTTVISASIDPFFFKVEEKDVTFIVNRSTLGQDEIDARRGQAGGLPVPDVFRVAVDGFTAAELGVTGPGSTLAVASPIAGMAINCTGNFSENGDYGTEIQRFTFLYSVDFPDDSAFGFAGPTEFVTLNVTVGGVSASGQIELIKQPDPFILHGDPAWLSIDLRVFVVRANERRFGVTMGNDASAAPGFIQQVMAALTAGNGTAGGESFDNLPTDESAKLFVYPTDGGMGGGGTPVFNFALAKVHYIGLIGATNVRVFFRLFQAQTTSGAFDYPPGVQYRRATSNPDGQPIPLAGIQGNEYVTIPCFATRRIDSTAVSMDQQTDDPYNVQTFTAHADGSEVDRFYGCWLDINQPFKPDGVTPNNVLPAQLDVAHPDGAYTDPSNPPLPIQQAILRSLHQCLIAEIAFDPVAIPLGKDPSNWDKLAQRNLAWSDVNSAQAVTTFEIRPTPAGLPAGQTPDELMIDWNNIPPGSSAQIYLPAVRADTVLRMADRMYTSHRLTRLDAHTLRCRTGGISYIPIPPGAGINYAGLLTVDLPAVVRRGEIFNVVVRQLTNAFGKVTPPPPPPPQIEARRAAAAAVAVPAEVEWRRVLGAFQLTIPVRNKEALLVREERELSVLRWIAEAIPRQNRWHPVFHRYLSQIAARVSAFGGNPTQILPSPTGEGRVKPRPPARPGEVRVAYTGKIAGLIFDHFGDFEGFLLETEEGEHAFHSHEKEVEQLAERVWRERLRITVWAERDQPHRPLSIVIRQPPAPFGQR
jgi:hypothetical protein